MRYWRLLVVGVAALIATDLMGMAIPWLIKGGIDTVIWREGGKGGIAPSLIKYPLMIVGAALLQTMLRYFWRMNIFGFSRRI